MKSSDFSLLVTVQEYSAFLTETGHEKPECWDKQIQCPQYPVVGVSAHDADAYAEWAGYRLPTEDEYSEHWRQWDGYGLCEWTSTSEGRYRVLRGGSWDITAYWCRSAYRYRDRPDVRIRNFGFRVCLVPEKTQ